MRFLEALCCHAPSTVQTAHRHVMKLFSCLGRLLQLVILAESVTERGGLQRGLSPTVCMLFSMSCRVSLSLIRLALPRNPTPLSKPVSPNLRTSILQVRSFNSVHSASTLFSMPERRPFVRLPTEVYPVNYGLRLKPDLIDFTFEGKLEAAVEVILNLMSCK